MTLHGADALVTGPDNLATVTYRGPHGPIDARPADPAGTLVRTPLGEGFIPWRFGAGRVVGTKDFHRDGVRFRIGDRELQAKRRRGMTRWARAVTISGPDGMWTWRHRGVLLGHRSLTRSDGVEIMRGQTRRPIKISDAATELDVAVGIASWSSGIEHQAARISVAAIFFEILSLP